MPGCQYLYLENLSFSLPHKTCFENFSSQVSQGDRVAIIGENGAGKTTLFKGILSPEILTHGKVVVSGSTRIGYLPQKFDFKAPTVFEEIKRPFRTLFADLDRLEQLNPASEAYADLLEKLLNQEAFTLEQQLEAILDRFELAPFRNASPQNLSGGEKMRLKLARLISQEANLLFLDEPTNHLDTTSREWVRQFLQNWKGALLVVTHDLDLLSSFPNRIWAFEKGVIEDFCGNYASYREKKIRDQTAAEDKWAFLKREKGKLTQQAQQEATKKAHKTSYGKRKYASQAKIIRNAAIERSEQTLSKSHKKRLEEKQEKVASELSALAQSKTPTPRFCYRKGSAAPFYVRIEKGSLFYGTQEVIKELTLEIVPKTKLAIQGVNGSGKTTFFKALMQDASVTKKGVWEMPKSFKKRIGYLDQNLGLLSEATSVWETIARKREDWGEQEIIHHLNTFLFYDRRTHLTLVKALSEGEKVRLALAAIAADAPDILLLDEATNHLDISTKTYLASVLKNFEGALLVNSHEEAFLKLLEIDQVIRLPK